MSNSTAWAIFSGIGGMSAILLLIFKDSILGLVAGFQLSSEKLLKLGDWLAIIPEFGIQVFQAPTGSDFHEIRTFFNR